MSLVKFANSSNPYRYNHFFGDDLFDWSNRQAMNSRTTLPSVNIKENEDGFVLELATPGLKKEDFKLELNNDILTISSEKKEEQEENNDNFSKQEFSYKSFTRSFTLPDSVKSEDIKAHYENGVLEIAIPKKEEAKPQPKMEITIS